MSVIASAMLSSSNAMDNGLDNVPTGKLPALLKVAQQEVKEERKEARRTGDTAGLEIREDRVINIKNEIKDRKPPSNAGKTGATKK